MHWELFSPHQDENGPSQAIDNPPDGLLYGYSVYTTLKLPLSEHLIDRHLQRLKKDCKAMNLSWRYTDHWVLAQLKAHFTPSLPVLRLTVFAEVDGYGAFYNQKPTLPSRMLLSARPASSVSQTIHLQSVPHQRSMPTIKHGAMAETIALKRTAQESGFDDILLLNAAQHVCEASTANFFLIQDGVLRTPHPERDGCLPGLTRQLVLEGADTQRIPTDDSPISLQDIRSAQGAFLTNATQGVITVGQIDNHSFPWPNEAKRLQAALTHIVNT